MSFMKTNAQEISVVNNRCMPSSDLPPSDSINHMSDMGIHEGGGCIGIAQHEVTTSNSSEKWVLPPGLGDVGVEAIGGTQPSVPPVLHAIDPDELFFQSLLPDVQLLGPQQKGVFKLKVQQLLQEKLFPKGCDCDVNGDEGRSGAVIHSPIPQPNHIQTTPATSAYGSYGVFSDRWHTNGNVGVNFCEYNKSN